MGNSRDAVLAYVIGLLEALEDDLEGAGPITEGTYLLGDRNWRSIDVVYLANSMQEHYGRTFPFTELFAEIGRREIKDISVGEWVDFIHQQLNSTAVSPYDEANA